MIKPRDITADMLHWYDKNRRDLPWRRAPGEYANPYHVWLSEIMLQQTTVATVKSYYAKFLSHWPDVSDMANAPLDDILNEWAGLGYYARARNLHKCAQTIMRDFNGQFPDTEQALLQLPGIGPYTAAAIASIAFQKKAVVVDGNIERVMSRLHKSSAMLPKEKKVFYELAAVETPEERCGDYAQSLMDLGATICTPRSPKCILCPIESKCLGKLEAENYPKKAPKKKKPEKFGVCFWIESPEGYILLHRRPAKGLLGGMIALPTTNWDVKDGQALEGEKMLPDDLSELSNNMTTQSILKEQVTHIFTHFKLELQINKYGLSQLVDVPENYFWYEKDKVSELGFPTLFKKAIDLLLNEN